MTYRDIDPKLAGIYIIKNNLNGKCYIGQSIKIRSRIKDHMRNAKNGKLDLPIYRAINKYGFHNFTIDILESFIPDADMTNTDLIKQLDQLEIKYIEEYNAYTDGYNCTKGGDFGVLGLKMTEEQKKKVSENSKKLVASGVFGKRVHLYNFVEKYYIYAWTIKDAASITKLSRSNIGRLCNNTYIHPFCNNFIAAYTKEELEDKKSKIPEWLEEYEKNKATLVERHRNGKVYFGNSNWIKGMVSLNKGKKMSEEQKEKLRIASTKDNILVATYIGMHNAAKSVNTDYKSIQRACNGRAKTCKGYIWKKELMQSDCKQTA